MQVNQSDALSIFFIKLLQALPDIGRDHGIAGRPGLCRRQHPRFSSEEEGGGAAAIRLKAQLRVTTAIHAIGLPLEASKRCAFRQIRVIAS